MTSKLIALVTVVAIVEGVRQEFRPGSELPELPEHDIKELKRMGAIADPVEQALADTVAVKAAKKDAGEFQRERAAITAAQASTATPAVKTTAAKK